MSSSQLSFGPNLQVLSKLGEGSFAEVFKVRSKDTGNYYAVKRLKKKYRSVDEVNRLPEIYALKALQGHPNVIRLEDLIYSHQSGYVAMVFELMDCNVYELISGHKRPFDEKTSLILIYQLLKAINHMHSSRKMFHRDIKPENCMVDKKTFVLKLCDFGSTRGYNSNQSVYNQPFTEYVSTRWYRAPECILTSGSYGPEVDEWAVGCMLYELMTTKPLFPGKHEIDQIARIHKVLGTPSRDILNQFKQNPNTQISFAFPSQKSIDLRNLIPKASLPTIQLLTQLLVYDPEHRISAGDALKLPAFEAIRQFEQTWENSSKSVPFPLAYLQCQTTANTIPPNKISPPIQNQNQNPNQPQVQFENPPSITKPQKPAAYPSAKVKQFGSSQVPGINYDAIAKQNDKPPEYQKSQFDYKPPINHDYSKLQPSSLHGNDEINQQTYAPVIPPINKKPNYQPLQQPHISQHLLGKPQPTTFVNQSQYQPLNHPQPLITVPKPILSKKPIDNTLAESRKKAALRIAQYKQKMQANQSQVQLQQAQLKAKKIQQPYHNMAYQIANSKIQNGGFQKPRPELVQPRLPKIVL